LNKESDRRIGGGRLRFSDEWVARKDCLRQAQVKIVERGEGERFEHGGENSDRARRVAVPGQILYRTGLAFGREKKNVIKGTRTSCVKVVGR